MTITKLWNEYIDAGHCAAYFLAASEKQGELQDAFTKHMKLISGSCKEQRLL